MRRRAKEGGPKNGKALELVKDRKEGALLGLLEKRECGIVW